MENPQNDDTLGILFPDEVVEEIGLKEGDVFDVVDTGDGFALRPVNPELAERMRGAFQNPSTFKAILQDLSKQKRRFPL
ncbi:AbrB/MazE/SpoVT family DNA-binding domain-containing protein [Rhizobium sp. TH2]|uniref:AbrB/MazE/SpoVT family DNA-binding domain-containing protein n=1 Tax=Rhizobium sp. TH2 TaxID=2775403 RepID=UPI002157A1BE|nr:AbrB/MazE/SpoVT family DNA-binding domain-containing protein [Rhizobium sp. TH2]UVC10712.1 AbrB/MazE/SpoVT family DNA-binding domain-containing protein [Rhizobium sp. TH2]